MAGAASVSVYGCIREIFESRYLRGVADDRGTGADEPGGGGAVATVSVHIKISELKWKNEWKLIYLDFFLCGNYFNVNRISRKNV